MVNDWLKFAETKNAGLLALSGVSLGAVLSFLADLETDRWSISLLSIGSALWICSVCLCVFSFIAVTEIMPSETVLHNVIDEKANLYFFMHLAEYSAETLLCALGKSPDDSNPRRRFELNLAEQVIQNSRITAAKLRLFNNAATWWVAGFLCVAAGVFASLNGG